MKKNGFSSHVHRKKPKGKPMPIAVRRANAAKSKVRSRVEHVFAGEKDRTGLFIRTIGIARARVKIGMANLVYNFKDCSSCEEPPPPDTREGRERREGRPRGEKSNPTRPPKCACASST
jgi:hypothetical protein